MTHSMICIECPKGCHLQVEINKGKASKVTGNHCPKGEQYAHCEIENPVRIVTTTVRTKGLTLSMLPVKTDKPIPRALIGEIMKHARGLCITRPLSVGAVVEANLLDLGINLVATRSVDQSYN